MNEIIEHGSRIVVGVDGSAGSVAALAWAGDQAELTGARVDAVAAWQDLTTYAYGFGFGYGLTSTVIENETIVTITEKMLAEAVADIARRRDPQLRVGTRVIQGHPAQVLLDAAVGARLLVVGSRGHGTLAGLLLGSVSQHCVQHAPCPVVVVPATTRETT